MTCWVYFILPNSILYFGVKKINIQKLFLSNRFGISGRGDFFFFLNWCIWLYNSVVFSFIENFSFESHVSVLIDFNVRTVFHQKLVFLLPTILDSGFTVIHIEMYKFK